MVAQAFSLNDPETSSQRDPNDPSTTPNLATQPTATPGSSGNQGGFIGLPFINFNDTRFDRISNVFDVFNVPPTVTISWSVHDALVRQGLRVEGVRIFKADPPDQADELEPVTITPEYRLHFDNNSAEIDAKSFRQSFNEPEPQFYLFVNWTVAGTKGSTRTPIFTIALEGTEPTLRRNYLQKKLTHPTLFAPFDPDANNPQLRAIIEGGAAGGGFGGGSSTNGPGFPQATATPTSVATNGAPGLSTDSASPSQGSVLSTGAIAGIAVGGAAVVVLALFLLWFFLIRNRRRARADPDHVKDVPFGAGPDGRGTHEYLTDKETHARVTESPRTPRSEDDGYARDESLLNPNGLPLQQDRAFSPYHDAPASGTAAGAPLQPQPQRLSQHSLGHDSRLGARSATPQGVNPAVAHLVEDGMTEAEIRRLEEEERALDAAIEQHGSRAGFR